MPQDTPEPPTSSETIHGASPIQVRVTQLDPGMHPDKKEVAETVLFDGPRSKKIASYWVFLDRHSGEVHHDAVILKTFAKRANGKLEYKPANSITVSGEGDADAIRRLVEFIGVNRSGSVPHKTGNFVVIQAGDQELARIKQAISRLSDPGKAGVVLDVLSQASADPRLLDVLVERAAADPDMFKEATAALNLAAYTRAVGDLKGLIQSCEAKESDFQRLLKCNPWMFGSEYSELLDQRAWTRDEKQDFVVRRTTDNYIEVIEIKTPLEGASLFNYDRSHDSWYPGAELSKVLGQVQKYIEELDAERNTILRKDGEDTVKIRSKVVIGRDGDDAQRKALRNLNGHLHRIEVLTFDHLLRIAENVLGYLGSSLQRTCADLNVAQRTSST